MARMQESGSEKTVGKIDSTVADWPLTFVRHNFGATSYSTYGCKVVYNGFLHLSDEEDVLQISSASDRFAFPEKTLISVLRGPCPLCIVGRTVS